MSSELTMQAAEAYLDGITLDERRRLGVVYTPEHIAQFVLDLAEGTGCAIDDAPLLDPACGAGVFLCEIVRRAARRIGDGSGPLSGARRRELLRVASRHLYGIDTDEQACGLAIRMLRATVQELAPGPLPDDFMTVNIVRGDFLVGDELRRLPPTRSGGFRFIVGNPPYVATTRLDDRHKAQLRVLFSTAVGRVDLYTLFIERALQVIAPGGTVAFITPDKFLASRTSHRLRTFISAHGTLRTVARFRSHKVFPGAAVVPCVTVIDRGTGTSPIEMLTCTTNGERVEVIERAVLPRAGISTGDWQFKRPELLRIVERLVASFPSLDARARRISAGPATGRDEVYVRPRAELEEVEPELVHAALRGRDIGTFSITDPNLGILLPYELRDGVPELVRLSRYPGAQRYLERHRGILRLRHCVRVWEKAWFDLHDQPATDLAGTIKIVVPDVAESCRFAVDRGRYFPLHSAYYIVPQDPADADLLAAVMNATVAEFVLRLLAPVAKDGFSRFRRQFLAGVPIANAPPRQRRDILAAVERGRLDDANVMVTRLYGLTAVELAQIDGFLSSLQARPDA